jgi:hypothetical protein
MGARCLSAAAFLASFPPFSLLPIGARLVRLRLAALVLSSSELSDSMTIVSPVSCPDLFRLLPGRNEGVVGREAVRESVRRIWARGGCVNEPEEPSSEDSRSRSILIGIMPCLALALPLAADCFAGETTFGGGGGGGRAYSSVHCRAVVSC